MSPKAPGISLEVDTSPDSEAASIVQRELHRYNLANGPFDRIRRLCCFARDASGALVGGAVGQVWGEVAELGQMWVADPHRRRSVGSELLGCFEAEAAARGASSVVLDTFTFHAPDFYLSHGYEVVARIDGFPEDTRFFVMRKTLG